VKTLLVPIDGSSASLRALWHAIGELRGAPSGRLHLLNVQQPPSRAAGTAACDEAHAELCRHGRETLTHAQTLARNAGVDIETHVRLGDAGGEIVSAALELDCDQIVMGVGGCESGGDRLGAVATQVVRTAGVPVTLVR
jgi:nucleotide-binding universal stress UspA family protein